MASTNQRLEVTLDTQLESADLAENIAECFAGAAGFGEEDIHKIGMAVREGVINAYNYGNRQDRRKKIFMVVEMKPKKMVIHLRDQGPGFEPAKLPDPLAQENLLRTSGRGVLLMRSFMDEFKVRRVPRGGAELVMAKKLPHAALGNGHSPS